MTTSALRCSLNFSRQGARRADAKFTRRLNRKARAMGYATYAQFEALAALHLSGVLRAN